MMFPWVSDTHGQHMRFLQDDEIRFTSMCAIFKRSKQIKGTVYRCKQLMRHISRTKSTPPQSQFKKLSRVSVPLSWVLSQTWKIDCRRFLSCLIDDWLICCCGAGPGSAGQAGRLAELAGAQPHLAQPDGCCPGVCRPHEWAGTVVARHLPVYCDMG